MIESINNFIANPSSMSLATNVFLLFVVVVLLVLMYKVRANLILRYEFLSIFSHKFRTPLTSMRWYTENLIESEKDELRKKSLQDIHVSNQQLIDLTNTLIELTDSAKFSKEQYHFEHFPICALVNDAANSMKDIFGTKNISFLVTCADPNMKINVDKGRFEFVIHTILENSAIYTKSGDKVEVSITGSWRKVSIVVADNGIGIPKHHLRRIFSEFNRAPNARKFDTEGLGVGLFLAQRIAHRLGGRIKANSEGEGKGSVFELILPKAR